MGDSGEVASSGPEQRLLEAKRQHTQIRRRELFQTLAISDCLTAHEIVAHPQTSFLRGEGAQYLPLPKMDWKMSLPTILCRSHCLNNRDI